MIHRARWIAGASAAAMAASWLAGSGAGPSPAVQPYLVTMACTAILLLLAGAQRLPLPLVISAFAFAAWAVIRGNGGLESYAVVAGVMTLLGAASAGRALASRPCGGRAIALALVAAALLSALIALAQYAGLVTQSRWWISGSPTLEAYGNLRQRNQFATLTVLGLAGVFWCASTLRAKVALLAPIVALLCVANAATTSRIGLVGLVLACAAAWRLSGAQSRAVRGLALLAMVAYAVGAVLLPAFGGSLASSLFERVSAAGACSSRRVLWSNVVDLISQRPWLGWGWGELDYAHYAHLYAGLRFCDILDNAHNLPLHLAVELGLPFAVLVSLGIAGAVVRLAPWRETQPDRWLALVVLGVIAAHSSVEYPLWYGPFQMACAVAVGVLCARSAGTYAPVVRWGGAALMGVSVVFAGAAYWLASQPYLPAQSRAQPRAVELVQRLAGGWLFRDHERFAALTTTPLTSNNAADTFTQAEALRHFSPEPCVIEKYIESAQLLGRVEAAALEIRRYRAAFSGAHARWDASSGERRSRVEGGC